MELAVSEHSLISRLPSVRGKLRPGADLAKSNWFQVGGLAEVLFKPENTQDIAQFLKHKSSDIAVTVLGVGSNILIRDGGISGVVIKLGRGFTDCHAEGDRVTVGAACLNSNVVEFAKNHGIGGLEFLSGIPGGIGGALAMNAGAYGFETKDILVEAEVVDPHGTIHVMTPDKLNYSYRKCGLPYGWVFTRATFQGHAEKSDIIASNAAKIAEQRQNTQPVRSRTGGSTFKNPEGFKAWKLIEAAGCRGMKIGGAQISEMHCNFMINNGNATAYDIETLGEKVREQVLHHSGILLEWEIKILGNLPEAQSQEIIAA